MVPSQVAEESVRHGAHSNVPSLCRVAVMRLGVVFPNPDIGDDPDTIVEFVTAAESIGYTHIRAYDHVLGAVHEGRTPRLRGPYTEDDPFHEPMMLFGFLAGMTRTIELVTGVLILPQRQTVLVAKQAAELSILSGGRLRLGVGSGWNYVEYEGLNERFDNRGRRMDDQIALLRALWTEKVIDYQSEWHRIDRAGILPRPHQPIPVWFGGFSAIARRRGVRLGDGFLFGGTLPDAIEQVPLLRAELARVGRDADQFGTDVLVHANQRLDQWRADYENVRRLGVSHLTMSLKDLQFTSARQRIDALHLYYEAVS